MTQLVDDSVDQTPTDIVLGVWFRIAEHFT